MTDLRRAMVMVLAAESWVSSRRPSWRRGPSLDRAMRVSDDAAMSSLDPSLDPLAAGAADPGSWTALLVYVSVALGVSFLCSIWEAVLLSTPRSHVELMVQAGSRSGTWMRAMRRSVERPISAILTLNTIAHTVGSAGAGAEAKLIFGSTYFGVATAVLTLLILVFSEIIPKTLGTVYCRRLAGFTGMCLHVLVKLLFPLVRLLELMTRMLRPVRKGPTVTRAELEVLARISAEEGGIAERERRTFENLLRLEDIPVRDVMTPRTILLALPESLTVGELLESGEVPPFSRIPISPGGADEIRAYVLRQDVFERGIAGETGASLAELGRPIHVVPETRSVAGALEDFIANRSHILLVADEYGGTSGLLTLEDAMETLLGREIVDESDRVADLQDLARKRQGLHWEWLSGLRDRGGRSSSEG